MMERFCLFVTYVTVYIHRLPRSLVGSPLRPGDDILEINGVAIVDQDQKEVSHVLSLLAHCLKYVGKCVGESQWNVGCLKCCRVVGMHTMLQGIAEHSVKVLNIENSVSPGCQVVCLSFDSMLQRIEECFVL